MTNATNDTATVTRLDGMANEAEFPNEVHKREQREKPYAIRAIQQALVDCQEAGALGQDLQAIALRVYREIHSEGFKMAMLGSGWNYARQNRVPLDRTLSRMPRAISSK
tara:strand:+ start:34 stop:360 length:327 start_codon:yes stop_codon:yes gene_type:complete